LLRWCGRLIAKKYDGSKSRTVGHPKTAVEIEKLIVQMAHQNRTGATREFVARSTIWDTRSDATRRHLQKAVKEYAEQYHLERNHQGLDNELIEKLMDVPYIRTVVGCREGLGGILKYYKWRAA